jgi:hypothetical protein
MDHLLNFAPAVRLTLFHHNQNQPVYFTVDEGLPLLRNARAIAPICRPKAGTAIRLVALDEHGALSAASHRDHIVFAIGRGSRAAFRHQDCSLCYLDLPIMRVSGEKPCCCGSLLTADRRLADRTTAIGGSDLASLTYCVCPPPKSQLTAAAGDRCSGDRAPDGGFALGPFASPGMRQCHSGGEDGDCGRGC